MKKAVENVKFGHRIASLRQTLGISQEKLSFDSKINRTYMGEIERGEKSPSLVTITKIAKGLNITLSELFNYE